MSDETYEGWKNRETWAFWLHVTNDQGFYHAVVDQAREFIEEHPGHTDYSVGEEIVEYVKGIVEESGEIDPTAVAPGTPLWGMLSDIGSWWRIDHREIGAAARELASDS